MIQPKRLLSDVELDDIECWLRHAVADSLRNRRLVQLAAALQQLRAARGVTQEDMLLATSRRHISRIEQGHQMPSIRVIENLAEGLQIHPLTLMVAAYLLVLGVGALVRRTALARSRGAVAAGTAAA